MKTLPTLISILTIVSIFCSTSLLLAGERPVERTGLQRLRQPLTEEQMEPWADIEFRRENFEKIQKGMTEEEVLDLLGKPIRVKMERRPKRRWTVHYFYPQGHVVNFKNGLVVGKERKAVR